MLGLKAGQSLVIEAPPVAAPLVEALASYAGRQGAHVVWIGIGGGYERAVLGSTEPATLEREHRLHSALMSTADALVGVDAAQDATGLAGIPADRYAAWARAAGRAARSGTAAIWTARCSGRWSGSRARCTPPTPAWSSTRTPTSSTPPRSATGTAPRSGGTGRALRRAVSSSG